MTTLNFPHRDDNHWLTIEVGGVEHPQYPSPLEVKMLIEEAVRKEREQLFEEIREFTFKAQPYEGTMIRVWLSNYNPNRRD